jgi:type VI secretion system protein ImpL
MFRDLLDSLNRTEATLGRPEVAVLAIDRFTLGPPWDTMLAAVEQSKFLGPKVRAEVEREGNAHLQRARHELESQTTAITGPVIERKPTTGALAMSSGSFALKSALEGVLSLRGAEATPKATPRLVLTGAERLVWDTKPLIEALHLYEQYEQFMAGEAKRFPEYLEGFVRRGALRNLEINMMELVTKAADIRPGTRDNARAAAEQDLRQETRSFRDANRALVRLLEVFRQLGFTTSYRDLTAALTTEAGRMLRDVDRVLNEDTLYSVKEGSIARWDGTRRLALTAFEATDAKDLEQYLDLQRERVRLLARDYADPAVSWLTSRADRRTPEQARLIAKWQRISSELERYDAKKPGNSITTLERFILVDMEQITRRNYFQKISARDLTEESADFFLQKRNALRRDLYRRAQAVGDSAAATEYAEIESFFNRRLAGRFPFAEPKAIRVDAEADIETIREFYAVFDRYGKPAREVLKRSVRFAGGNEAAIDFLDQMDAVRTFLAPLLDRKNPAPGFDLDVDFRVNREREIGGRQIIDWTMAVGEQRIRYRDAKRQAKWQVGDPIRVSLRWAKDYPFAPTSDGSEGVTIEDRTVTWDFLNNWSLLAVLMRHTAGVADGETIADPRPTMLRFGVAMRPDRVAGAPAEAGESQARVYIRTVLTAGEKKDPLRLPQFPARAPQLTATARR